MWHLVGLIGDLGYVLVVSVQNDAAAIPSSHPKRRGPEPAGHVG